MPDEDVLSKAHSHSLHNKAQVEVSALCGCFCCEKTFVPSDHVLSYTDKVGRKGVTPPDQTVICPFCGIDAVIGSSSGYPITPSFLSGMHKQWFAHIDLND